MSKTAQKKVNLEKEIMFLFLSVFVVFVLVLTAFNISLQQTKKVLGASTDAPKELSAQIEYWKSFVNKNPTYLPAYLEIARLENAYGNNQEANSVLIKGGGINPNATELLLLQKQVNQQY